MATSPIRGSKSGWGLLVAVALLTASSALANRTAPFSSEPHLNQTTHPLNAKPTTTLPTPSGFHPIAELHLHFSSVRVNRQLSRGVLPIPSFAGLGWTQVRPWPGTVTEQPAQPGQGPAQYVQRSEYDLAGRPVRSIAPDGEATTFTYDPLGRLSTRLDPDQRLHTWDTCGAQ